MCLFAVISEIKPLHVLFFKGLLLPVVLLEISVACDSAVLDILVEALVVRLWIRHFIWTAQPSNAVHVFDTTVLLMI